MMFYCCVTIAKGIVMLTGKTMNHFLLSICYYNVFVLSVIFICMPLINRYKLLRLCIFVDVAVAKTNYA